MFPLSDKANVHDENCEELGFYWSNIDPSKVELIFEAGWPWKTLWVESIEFLGEKDVGHSLFAKFYW